MPNLCDNRLTVTGLEGDVAAFCRAVSEDMAHDHAFEAAQLIAVGTDMSAAEIEATTATLTDPGAAVLLFSKTVPEGNDIRETSERWGTKWEPDVWDMARSEGAVRFIFSSAWCPPDKWLAATARQFPTLAFELVFAETGAPFAGVLRVTDTTVEDVTFAQGTERDELAYVGLEDWWRLPEDD